MTIDSLINIFVQLGCDKFYAKELSENDNSKQQIYLGANFQEVTHIPKREISSDHSGDRKTVSFKADLTLYWLNENFKPELAPKAKLIWYPNYPEVRLSGFLFKCSASPSEYMSAKRRLKGRVLFFGIDSAKGVVFCYLGIPDSQLSLEFLNKKWKSTQGVLIDLKLTPQTNSLMELMNKLYEIHHKGFIDGCKMELDYSINPYKAQNAGGLTLEAMLGIKPNSYSEPDYLGWEIKSFGVKDFDILRNRQLTLFTSEPDLGLYPEDFEKFMFAYGKAKTQARIDFTGGHLAKLVCSSTGLRMIVKGFNFEKNEINQADGRVVLLDNRDEIAAGWSFSKLLDHWEKKHANACYVPVIRDGSRYAFGNNIILGLRTSFLHFITALNYGIVKYDPGNNIKFKNGAIIEKKQRNQFRMSSSYIGGLYNEIKEIDIIKEI
ncbi:MvaI/BcnI family restriction endonuclease [Salinimicrobium sediminilitoris]|uniref:MvaI/BcnI family restriction endonuclease n=1 Tax=Salinimicrobium sediminilitoris TaxID=2876715 RepID=UPI001E40F54B|nr:MvaI/BcnI family restriction endonuclease [Salinimicrobium sediminilitoris]MCC8361016.1 MvaI/BcnI restriction endonuclease family protein [Salinimicrobium sediminilitoris]